MKKTALIICSIIFLSFSCKENLQEKSNTEVPQPQTTPVEITQKDGIKFAYFASGCFWCVEAVYESTKGVPEVINGYAGGHTDNPTYEASNTGKTGHAEAVEVQYNPDVISFSQLVDVYFGSQNPTQINGQGPDNGSQYRSIIFYQNDSEKKIIEEKKEALAKKIKSEIAAEILPFQKFWKGEEYHQNYEKLHPNQPYIKSISVPRLKRFQAKFPELLKEASTH